MNLSYWPLHVQCLSGTVYKTLSLWETDKDFFTNHTGFKVNSQLHWWVGLTVRFSFFFFFNCTFVFVGFISNLVSLQCQSSWFLHVHESVWPGRNQPIHWLWVLKKGKKKKTSHHLPSARATSHPVHGGHWTPRSDRFNGGESLIFHRVECFLFLFISWSLSLSSSLLIPDSSSWKKKGFFRNFFMRQASPLSWDNFMLFYWRGGN